MLDILFLFFTAILPRFGSLDFVILCSLLMVIVKIISSKTIKYDKKFIITILPATLILLSAFFSFLYNGDLFGIIRLIKMLILLILVPMALMSIDEKKFHVWFVIFLIVMVLVLYIEYFDLFGLRSTIIKVHDTLFSGREVSYRAKGFFAGYSAAGVSCGFISLYALFFTIQRRINTSLGWLLYVLSFLATFFTGRTGIFITVFGSVLFFAKYRKIIFSRSAVIIVFSIVICLLLFLFNFGSYLDYENLHITYIRTFELFLNYQDNGSVSSESTTQLMKTMSLPSSLFEMIFGNGFQPWSIQSINAGAHQTDSGIIQTVFMYGIVGLFFYYIPVVYIWVCSLFFDFKYNFSSYYLRVVIPLAFISEIKGHYIYSNLIFIIIIFPFFLGRVKQNKFFNSL